MMACDVSRVVMFLCERVLKEDLVFFYSVSELFPNKASDCRLCLARVVGGGSDREDSTDDHHK